MFDYGKFFSKRYSFEHATFLKPDNYFNFTRTHSYTYLMNYFFSPPFQPHWSRAAVKIDHRCRR